MERVGNKQWEVDGESVSILEQAVRGPWRDWAHPGESGYIMEQALREVAYLNWSIWNAEFVSWEGLLSFPSPIRKEITFPLRYAEFVLFNSGPVADRLLILATIRNVEFLWSCDIWFVDETLMSSPALFDQVFVLYGFRSKHTFPLTFCLTPDRTTQTYSRILQNEIVVC